MESTVYIGFGGNLGDVLSTFREAHSKICSAVGTSTGFSSIYSSKPLIAEEDPVKDKPPYFNGCGRYQTILSPFEVLQKLLQIEYDLGRSRIDSPRWSSRTIDLDILLFADEVINSENLVVPHPRLSERDFCLEPLLELDIGLKHPITGKALSTILEKLPKSLRFITGVIHSNFL